MTQIELIRASSADWRSARDLRLEMLADSPRSFMTRLEDVRGWDDERWQLWSRSITADDSVQIAAVDGDGVWVGQACGRVYGSTDPARVYVIAVYVAPPHRGRALASNLIAEVARWAADRGFDALWLDVHEDAAPARASYERQGFQYTGVSEFHPHYPGERELEMRLPLG